MCRVLDVSRAAYYEWASGKKSERTAGAPGFARWITHPVTRKRLHAKDYGYKAWPLRGSEAPE